jgi:hypothetical protein
MKTRNFPLRTVLYMTSAYLLFENNNEEERKSFIDIFTWMVGNHQPRSIAAFGKACGDHLCDLYPELSASREIFRSIMKTSGNKYNETSTINGIQILKNIGCKDEYEIPQLPEELFPKESSLFNLIEQALQMMGLEVQEIDTVDLTEDDEDHVCDLTTQGCCQTLMMNAKSPEDWANRIKTVREANNGQLPGHWDDWIWKSGLATDVRQKWNDIKIEVK